jgi:hypothetical protein
MTHPQVTHVTETITPELAQKYLDMNRLNRPIREWRLKLLISDMEKGRYVENGEGGITFDWNGDIAAGQHTLTAVVRSGVTITCRVTRGVDPAWRSTMNDSMHQQFRDDLHIAGVADSSAAEALIRKVIVWEATAKANKGQGGLMTWRGNRISRSALTSEWPTYAAGITATIADTKTWRELWGGVGNRGAMQMFRWILTEKHAFPRDKVEDFFSRCVYGSQDEADRVLFQKLRIKLAANPNTPQQVFWLIRAWNAWVNQENMSKLQEPKGGLADPFPKLRRPNR